MVIPNTTTASENLPNSTSQRHLLSSSTSSDTTTTTHPFLNSVRPSWLQRTLQVAFFPHSPPSSSSSSLLPTTISPSSSFPCPKPFPRIHRSLLSYLPWKPSKHFLSFFHPSSTSTNTSYFNGFFFFQLLFYIVWFVSMVVMVYFHVYGCSAIHPTSQERVLTSSISSTASFWKKKSECGLNGTKCSPFKDEMELFRCAGFSTKTKVLQETFIGLLRLMEVPKVIGGLNQIYRGDSWICSSAVDAQVISNSLGGCVMVKTLGSQTQVLDGQPLTSVLTKKEEKENDATTITSSKKDDLHPLRVPFSSYFPLTYRVDSCSSPMGCIDLTWIALVVQILALTLCMVSVQGCPTLVLFFIYMVIGYWHVIFISDSIYYDKTFLEIAFASFLPYLTFVYVIYQVTTVTVMLKCTTYFLLDGFLSQVIPLMVGLHFNYIAMLFPSFTFTAIGFREQWPMVLFLALSVLFLMLYFGFYQRSFHHLHRLLFGYLVLVMVYVSISLLANLKPHLHHYLVSLFLFPLTRRVQTRFSLCVHFFLLGMFIQGVARWGLDGPFDTPAEALQGRDDPTLQLIQWNQTSFQSYLQTSSSSAVGTASFLTWSRKTKVKDQGIIDDTSSVATYRILLNDVYVNDTSVTQFNPRPWFTEWNVDHLFIRISINDTEVYSKPIQVFKNGTVVDTLLKPSEKVT